MNGARAFQASEEQHDERPAAGVADDLADAGPGGRRHRLARRRHRREHRGVLVDPGDGPAADPRRRRRRPASSWSKPRADTGSYPGASWLEYRDLHDRMRTLPDLFAYRMVPFNVGESGRTERTHGLLVSGNYFSALGLKPALGRFLQPDEAARAGGAPVVVISYSYWQTRFGGAADALDRTLRVNDRQLTIVGVTPERFQGTVTMLTFDLWVPATMAPELFAGSRELEDRGQRGYNVAGRLAPAATPQGGADRARRRDARSSRTTIPRRTRRSAARCCRSGRRRAGRSSSSSARWRSCRRSCCCCCWRSAATPPT